MCKISFNILLLFTSLFLYGQNKGEFYISNSPNLIIEQNYKISKLIKKYYKSHKDVPHIKGFRIQIFSRSGPHSKNKAKEIENNFKLQFPNIATYIKFKTPNFILLVGNYREKNNAKKDLNTIKKKFLNSFIKESIIEFPSF